MTDTHKQDAPPPAVPMFSGQPMYDYFCRMAELGPSVSMAPSSTPLDWHDGASMTLPDSYEFAGGSRQVEEFLIDTDTAALLVLQDGKLRFERYAHTGGRDVPWISMSAAKSFVSALVGIAAAQGMIGDLDEPISRYIDVKPGSAYDGVAIRDVLQMSSGARWDEDYSNPESDIFRLSAAFFGVGTFDDFIATAVRESAPGSVCRYNSADTQALATLLVRATGRSLADYMQAELIEPLGMTAPSHWLVDGAGREAAYFGLNMTARDFAKLGELYRCGGAWQGQQLVPASFVADSVAVSAAHTSPGRVWVSDHEWDLGYGYQWWLPEVDSGEFSAIGIYNQLVYVHRPSRAVIVKLSANRSYGLSTEEATNRDLENVVCLRSIARSLG